MRPSQTAREVEVALQLTDADEALPGARTRLAGLALGLSVLWSLGCGAQTKVQKPAPEPATAEASSSTFITHDQVDGSLNGWITSVRYQVTYREGDMWTGAPDGALVTIVDFSDFECPYCKRLAGNLHEVLNEDPDDVRIVIKHFPLERHVRGRAASEAVLAAHAQGKGFEMYAVVFANARELSRDDLIAYAEEVGLADMARFNHDIENRTYASVVDADIEMGRRFRVQSTPSFFINGRPETGAKSVEELRRLIEDEKIFARKLIDAGSARDEVYARIMRAAKEQRWASR
jgi:protein-disulfide isomerase